MRRLLGVLVVAAIVVAAAWVATPLVASGLVRAAVVGAGLDAATTRVQVEADPPFALLLGHADAVRIQSSGDTLQGVRVQRLDLILHGVSLFARTADTVDGTLSGVAAATGSASLRLTEIQVGGTPRSAGIAVHVDLTDLAAALGPALAESGVRRVLDVRPSPPDSVTASVDGRAVTFVLAIAADGSLIARASRVSLPPAVLWRPADGEAVRLERVEVTASGVVVTGTIDAWTLLGRAIG